MKKADGRAFGLVPLAYGFAREGMRGAEHGLGQLLLALLDLTRKQGEDIVFDLGTRYRDRAEFSTVNLRFHDGLPSGKLWHTLNIPAEAAAG